MRQLVDGDSRTEILVAAETARKSAQLTVPDTPVRSGDLTSRARVYVYEAVAAVARVNRFSRRVESWSDCPLAAFRRSITREKLDRSLGVATPACQRRQARNRALQPQRAEPE